MLRLIRAPSAQRKGMTMQEKFHWKSADGVEIVLPHMDKIKAGVIRRHRKEEPVDFIFSILEDASDADMLARADELTSAEINDLFEAWQKAGASLGESAGSST